MRKQAGFTLMELLIVIAIISILASIGYTSYAGYMVEARRGEAVSSLLELSQAQEKYYLDNNIYARERSELGVDESTYASNYKIIIKSAGTRQSYTLHAIAKSSGAQTGDTDCQEIVFDSVGTKTPTLCW